MVDETLKLEQLIKENEKLKRSLDESLAITNNVTHEIRNPLHALCNISEYIINNIDSLDKSILLKYLGHILKNSTGIKKITDDILDFSKFRAGKMSISLDSVDPLELLEEAVEDCRALSLENVTIELAYEDNYESTALKCDHAKIRQVLRNLIINGLKYSDGKPIKISLGTEKSGGFLQIGVSDLGKGIDEKDLQSIFEPFVRLEKCGGKIGTGLGLSLSKEIIEKHGGKIWAANNLTGGATVYFTLPLLAQEQSVQYYEEA